MVKNNSVVEQKILEIINKEINIVKESGLSVEQTRKDVAEIEKKILENHRKISLLL